MKIISIKRKTKYEKKQHVIMGNLITKVTWVKKYFLSLPIKTIRKHKETYYEEIKNYEGYTLFI
ncbi:hypothetical protein [Polaribacter cellanae]|uniref:Uncharacterized protein n=1 Tax=Polaribacter cellanae TaxID=2818493 RepID=A0A975CM95_9FLAO|nr:hypothetical protein [Polaribacter cellanae]QTE21682.1 hypothetical protein J3359_12735 [Polaribacter cellanae]